MAEDKTAELVQTVKDTVKSENSELATQIKSIETSLEGYASKDVVDGIKAVAEKAVTQEELTAVKETLDLVDQTVKAIKATPNSDKRQKSIFDFLNDSKKAIEDFANKEKPSLSLKDFSITGNLLPSDSGVPFIPIDYRNTVSETPDIRERFNLLDYITVGSTNGQVVSWMEEVSETGSAEFIDECVLKPIVSKDWKRNEAKVKKVADFSKVCEEVLWYMPRMRQMIEQFLRKLVYVEMQEQMINGDGLGQNLLGLTEIATAFVAGSKASSVKSANYADAIRASASQIRCLGFEPDCAFVNCDDMFIFESIKDENGQYLNAPLGGVRLIECPFITPGEFLVADCSLANADFFQGINSEWDRNDNDFRENAISVRSEALLAFYVAGNYVTGFVTDSFANVISLINNA